MRHFGYKRAQVFKNGVLRFWAVYGWGYRFGAVWGSMYEVFAGSKLGHGVFGGLGLGVRGDGKLPLG